MLVVAFAMVVEDVINRINQVGVMLLILITLAYVNSKKALVGLARSEHKVSGVQQKYLTYLNIDGSPLSNNSMNVR